MRCPPAEQQHQHICENPFGPSFAYAVQLSALNLGCAPYLTWGLRKIAVNTCSDTLVHAHVILILYAMLGTLALMHMHVHVHVKKPFGEADSYDGIHNQT